jgi:deazaflavin-dependent oxidoreductase (nitroreductase family)
VTPGRSTLKILWKLHLFWWRISGGRIGAFVTGLPVLELVTTGRTSEEPRSVLLNHVEHERGWVVVASNAGSDTAPAWCRNLEANPDATVRLRATRASVHARVLEGDERGRAWSAFVAANHDYADYEAATARPIPVVLLERTT